MRPAATQARSSAAEERNPRADQAVGEVSAGGDTQTGILKPGAPALFGPEALVRQRLIDQALRDVGTAARLLLFNRDRDREVGYAVKEVGGAVERVDDPARLVGVSGDFAPLLK